MVSLPPLSFVYQTITPVMFSSLTTLLKLIFAKIYQYGSPWKMTSALLNPMVSFSSLVLSGIQDVWFSWLPSSFYNTISNYCLLYISIFIFLLYHCAWFQTTLHFSFHILFGLGMPQHSVLFNHIHSLSVIICCLMVSNSIWRQNSQTYTYT